MDVAQVGNPVDDTALPSKECGGKDGKCRIFRAANTDFPFKASPPMHENFIHDLVCDPDF
jgi:hypothetical protein